MAGPTPTVTPFPLSLQDFQNRYPEFKATDTTLVSVTLNDSALLIDQSVWLTLAGQGHGLLTAHNLALSPFGQQARMVAKDGTTVYQKKYEKLVGIVGSGFRTL